jgi:imidazolonepropionase-like amidohydrolase
MSLNATRKRAIEELRRMVLAGLGQHDAAVWLFGSCARGELLRRAGELGVIAPGARADLITVDGDPLADLSLLDGQGKHIDHIMMRALPSNEPYVWTMDSCAS